VDVFSTGWQQEGNPATKLCTSYPLWNVLSLHSSSFTAVPSPAFSGHGGMVLKIMWTSSTPLSQLVCIFFNMVANTAECMQVMLINAAKDVASALSHLIHSAKNASGKQGSHPAMGVLKESAKVSFSPQCSMRLTFSTMNKMC